MKIKKRAKNAFRGFLRDADFLQTFVAPVSSNCLNVST